MVASRYPSLSDNFRNFGLSAFRPVLEFSSFCVESVTSGLGKISNLSHAMSEYESLRRENRQLKKEIIEYREVSNENERLRELLDFKEEEASEGVAAQVIARDISGWARWVVINKGKKDGIRNEMPVVTHDGLVGKVVSTGPLVARVMLISDNSSKVSVVDQETRDTGLLTGTAQGELKARYIDLESDVKVGDILVTSGLGSVYPKGIPVGKIQFLGKQEDGLCMYALVEPFAELGKLEEVLCLEASAKELLF